MARSTSALIELGERPERRLLNAVLFTEKSGESANAHWVALAISVQDRFHVVAISGGLVSGGVRRRHGTIAGDAPQKPLEQGTELVSDRRPARAAVAL